jgi:hypothetical protein
MEPGDHLFWHESGRMVAALTRIFGVHNLVVSLHDELLVEAREKDAGRVRTILQETMTEAFMLTFPGAPYHGVAEAAIGADWYGVKHPQEANSLLAGIHRRQRALGIEPPPAEQLIGRNAMADAPPARPTSRAHRSPERLLLSLPPTSAVAAEPT